ncbi:DoxX family protein [Gordonia sp. FQ]|uniref:DoxX family protein n=1 Tax=Gordonia sp. FQ TaxID=3446634 RepID=UPI003F86DECB
MGSSASATSLLRDPDLYLLAAAGQAADAAACVKPIAYIGRCLDTVGVPADKRWIFPVVKTASAVGLASARVSPGLARLTAAMLTVYFCLAVGAHLRVRDLRLNFAAASSLLVFYAALTVTGPPTPATASPGTR